MTNPQPLEPDVIAMLQKGKKIQAIKLVREHRGMGLKEAKELVEQHMASDENLNVAGIKTSDGSGKGLVIFTLLVVLGFLLWYFFVGNAPE